MKNSEYLSRQSQCFIDGFISDHDIELIGEEQITSEHEEAECSWNGRIVGYRSFDLTVTTFTVGITVTVHLIC